MINLFIPSAGLGERLRPLTNYIPKPLLPIMGRPILEIILENLYSLNPDHIGINLHYKGEKIAESLNNSVYIEKITFFKEAFLLGTGGALKNAEGLLNGGTFLVHNSDILSDIDLSKAIEFHKNSEAIGTLIVHDHPEFNNLIIDREGSLITLDTVPISQCPKPLIKRAFTGIAIYEPEFLDFIPEGYSSVTEAWARAIRAGQQILTVDVTGSYWADIGRPSAYAKAVFDALRRAGENIFVKKSNCSDIIMKGFVSIEGKCSFGQRVSLRNCIVLERENLPSGEYENSIIGPDFEIGFDEKEVFDSENGLILIGTGGSDRRYYRAATKQDRAAVIVKYPEETDFNRHIEYTRFFRNHNIPVPELFHVEHKNRTALFEDLGDTSLYNWLKCRRKEEEIERMYHKVLDVAASIHLNLMPNVHECPLLEERLFDFNYFRWETDYFIERFVKTLYGEDLKNEALLAYELDRLALKADSFPKTVIHRDFQCQNIMIKNGIPYIIDYQGARIGPPAYDIASLLWDPYHRLDDAMRERLLQYYIKRMVLKSERSEEQKAEVQNFRSLGLPSFRVFSPEVFLDSLLPCRLQRHMQALGAYGFLSVVKGKRYFLKFVPEALRMLKEEIVMAKEEYPYLYELISGLSPQ